MKIKNSEEILNTGVMGDTHVWMREIAAQIARLNETLTVLNATILSFDYTEGTRIFDTRVREQ